MGIIETFLLVIFIICSLLMVALVLMQHESGDGLGGIFGGGSNTNVGNRSGNIMTRITSFLGAIFLLCAISLAWLNRTPDTDGVEAAARQIEGQNSTVEWWRTDEEFTQDLLDATTADSENNSNLSEINQTPAVPSELPVETTQ